MNIIPFHKEVIPPCRDSIRKRQRLPVTGRVINCPPMAMTPAAPALTCSADMADHGRSLHRLVGGGALSLAAVFTLWLPLGVLGVVPFVLELPGESHLRSHAAAAVLCLLVAAWGFWERET